MPPAGTRRILVVDDDEDDFVLLRSLLLEILSDPLDLHWARRQQAAAELASQAPFDLYFVAAAPNLAPNGFEIAAAIRARSPQARIILLTSFPLSYVAALRQQYGFERILEKPGLSAPSLRAEIFSDPEIRPVC